MMCELFFSIYKAYLFISFIAIIPIFVLSICLIYKAITIKTDVTITYSTLVKINRALIINIFIMFILSSLVPVFLVHLN